MSQVIVEIDGKRFHLTDPEIQAHTRYLAEHEAILAKQLRGLLYHELVLIRSPRGNGAKVVNESLPFTQSHRAKGADPP